MTLKLSDNDLNQIVHEIKRRPFYNELGKYRNRSNGFTFVGIEEREKFNEIVDSLVQTNYRGGWFRTDKGYEFADVSFYFEPRNLNNSIYAKIDELESILVFRYNKL